MSLSLSFFTAKLGKKQYVFAKHISEGLVSIHKGASQVALVVKNPPVNAGDISDAGSTLGSGRSPGGGHDNPLQYSCLENPMDCSLPGSSVHEIFQARILEWVATSYSQGSNQHLLRLLH